MTEQKRRIAESAEFIRTHDPLKGKTDIAVVSYYNDSIIKEFQAVKRINYSDILPIFTGAADENKGEFIFASIGNRNVYLLNGHHNFFSGYSMRDAAHPVYVLKELGVKTVILIDEVGHLNPRFEVGGISFIYDHINLMGGNPLIGENDDTLGPRFPDMSDPYNEKLYKKIEQVLTEKKFTYYPSVYLGVTGPETETEAECRFYREIGADVLGYSIIPENLAAVHTNMKCVAFGMITRELVADRLTEISSEEKLKNRHKAEKSFAPLIKDIIAVL